MTGIDFLINILIRDQDGRLLIHDTLDPHSFVRNWYVYLIEQTVTINCRSALGLSMVNTSGTSYSSDTICLGYIAQDNTRAQAGAGVTTHGLLVGSSNTPYQFNQYALAAQIGHGTGAGQLSYAAMPAPTKQDDGTERKITWIRQFSNNSSGNVTVREIGWAIKGTRVVGAYTPFLLLREVCESPYVLEPAKQLEVQLQIRLIYPEPIS